MSGDNWRTCRQQGILQAFSLSFIQVTPATLESLHQLASYLGEASDYQNAMLFYTSMVSGPSFSEIATFAPSIKILIQQAVQLQIVWS